MRHSNTEDFSAELRKLPQVDRLSQKLGEASASSRVKAARMAVEQATKRILEGATAPSFDALVDQAQDWLRSQARNRLVPLINATGVLLHTNLGRAPLASQAMEAINQIGRGYSNLEYDLAQGSRGSRYTHASEMLVAATGAESALVVNNNAAAVLLALSATARSREVIVSRGEQIEIGGEFRIPEIIAESGAVMREVGTTNRTHLKDYVRAITPDTAAILKVHPSNYRVVGFTASATAPDLAALCRERDLKFVYDLGSGLLSQKVAGVQPRWLSQEPSVAEAVACGADLICFSGDKLLGGPQAGILIGKQELLDKCRRSSLLRAFRVDKTTLAALESTLALYLDGLEAQIPFWEMALADTVAIESRAASLVRAVGDAAAKLDLADGFSTPGGGSAPGAGIPTVLIEISPRDISSDSLLGALRDNDPPIVARIENDRVVIDLRTVQSDSDILIAESLRRILS